MVTNANDPTVSDTFQAARAGLQQARQQAEAGRMDLFLARERLKEITVQEARLDRVFDPDDQGHLSRRRQLERQRAEAEATLEGLQAGYAQQREEALGQLLEFARLSDPRIGVSHLSDRFPFLLMPVRIETRFKRIEGDGEVQHQLWVRIYPDDCAVDAFEPVLADVEIENARLYWIESWRAGGDEAMERGAWRALVGSHGSGRAAWILGQYEPANRDDKPKRDKDSDIILVMATTDPLPEAEQEAAEVYWRAVWLADGDTEAEAAARAALAAEVGEARATVVAEDYRPANLEERPAPPLTSADVALSVAPLVLPRPEDLPTKRDSWSQPARVNIMPDRFVLYGYVDGEQTLEVVGGPISSPLVVGPDPSAEPTDQFRQEDGDIIVGEEMRWMVDFEEAIQKGMGFRIDLSPVEYRRGFDRLVVLGLRLGSDEVESQTLLETLFHDHQHSRDGFSLLPQGTATNNTEEGAGFSHAEDADASFDLVLGDEDTFTEVDDWLAKRDGQWLAECLGIEPDRLKKVLHSDGTDQAEARAMNVCLWPATLGYLMDSMMEPVFDEAAVLRTRWFFSHFVSGRGMVPAVRIGPQPYGILPTTAFSKIRWVFAKRLVPFRGLEHPSGFAPFLRHLYQLLSAIGADWEAFLPDVAYVGKEGDAHQILLDAVGLHSGSVEYYQAYAESLEQLYNRMNLSGLGRILLNALIAAGYLEAGLQLLRDLGYTGEETPEILEKFFLQTPNKLLGPLIDDRPLSETEPIRAYTPAPDARNYLAWLWEAARTSLETLRKQEGFAEDDTPRALLYILLRHALMLGYWDAGIRFYRDADILTGETLRLARQEPKFIHVADQAEISESRWHYLYQTEARITDSDDLLIAEFIPLMLGEAAQTRYLDDQIRALEQLIDAPTARLERALAEHIDTVTYRLDAWKLGLVHYQLAAMRYRGDDEGGVQRGLYLGMYGWLEEVRPEHKVLTPVDLDPELEAIFQRADDPPLLHDSTNAGYVHAPSLNHAVTAAVLRNGYLSNASPGNPDSLAINLSSERVRRALGVLEGIRNGQSLAALLGYQFERGLHDSHEVAEVDQFIYKLRKAFPLMADRFGTTKTEKEVAIQAIEARNVIDGLELVNHVKQPGQRTYPFGKGDVLPEADPDQADAINAEVDRLLNLHDAVADLAMAEGVHQAVQGNYDRAAATLDAYSKATFPTEPDVVQTPRSGILLTHRLALHLEAGRDPTMTPVPGLAVTPRAHAEPAVNAWLANILPEPDQVACQVTYIRSSDGTEQQETITQEMLGLQPLDLLYLLEPESQQAMTALDDRVLHYVHQTRSPRPQDPITIQYMERVGATIPTFELAALVRSLRALVLRSRPLRSTDAVLSGEATEESEADLSLDKARIEPLKVQLEGTLTSLRTFQTGLETLLADKEANPEPIYSGVDLSLTQFTDLLAEAAAFGLPQTGFGFVYEWKRRTFGPILATVQALVDGWQDRLDQYDVLLLEYAALPPGAIEERFTTLQRAEQLVSTSLTTPRPDTPEELADDVGDKRDLFVAKKGQFETVLGSTTTSVSTLRTEVVDKLPIDDFDLTGLDLTDVEAEILRFVEDLAARAKGLADDLEDRLADVNDQLAAHDAASEAEARVNALLEAGARLLGEEFRLVPEFSLSGGQGDEWANAWGVGDPLLRHLVDNPDVDFPVDDWLHGLARVREKAHHWENVTFLTSAFGRAEPDLHPMQLPYRADDYWLALPFPEEAHPDGDRLLYTAHYAVPFDKNQPQCGLLLDEWSEVIPARDETTGLTFHYDRPSTEPPQVMLLVTPPDLIGHWQWQDLIEALHETLEMAKRRAIEPEQVDDSAYARFLPATLMAATVYPITIAANLAWNHQIFIQGNEEDNA